jgi:hypothetical protein
MFLHASAHVMESADSLVAAADSGDSAAEARRKCPDVQLVHVATIAPGDTVPRYHDDVTPRHKVSR